jgi:hypothetical protein
VPYVICELRGVNAFVRIGWSIHAITSFVFKTVEGLEHIDEAFSQSEWKKKITYGEDESADNSDPLQGT